MEGRHPSVSRGSHERNMGHNLRRLLVVMLHGHLLLPDHGIL